MLSIIACCATRGSIRTDVTINEPVDVIERAVGVNLERAYDRTKPQGVDGRSLKLLPHSGRGEIGRAHV